ncbi:MAG TPA: TIGR00730 family Rossman fold protein [Rhizomicrobium sp.]|nr:TIGR00730 family Rossman fold protein [Rhizomicrobium sp.]
MNDIPRPHPDKKRLFACVFCGSSHGVDPVYAATAKRLGELLAASGYGLVFGGGNVGLMGEVARAARDGGVPVQGILPDFLKHLEPPLKAKEKVLITPDLQTRKLKMLAMSDAFIILPGGLGTLDEYFEVVTSAQLRVFAKPIIVVDVGGYYAPLLALLENIVKQGFAKPEALKLHHRVTTADDAIATLNRLLAPQVEA